MGQTHGAGCTAWVAGGCSGSYICGNMLVRLDGIWVMLANVVMSMSVFPTTNDLDNVQCTGNGGREPQSSGIIENRYGLSGKQWSLLLATLMVMVCCTQGGLLV